MHLAVPCAKLPFMSRLMLLFVLVPALELVLLIEIGSRIGTLSTLALIVVTGVVGAQLAGRQGLDVLRRIQQETSEGRLPAVSVIDGAFILVAGALLVTPGILTDVVGLLFLVPAFRRCLGRALRRRFEQAVREGRIHVEHVQTQARWEPRELREEKVVRDLRDRRDPSGPPAEDELPRSHSD
jgi:UPF0716 protein FxsA